MAAILTIKIEIPGKDGFAADISVKGEDVAGNREEVAVAYELRERLVAVIKQLGRECGNSDAEIVQENDDSSSKECFDE